MSGVNSTGDSDHPVSMDGLLCILHDDLPQYSTERWILVDAATQRLMLIEHQRIVESWIISTASAGLGNQQGSNQTPLGFHRIKQCYGENAASGTIFKARQATGRIAEILTEPGAHSNADNITSRIMWLDGLQPGINQGGAVDSFERYIYIHGTDEEGRLGQPASHGCIRMRNADVIALYEWVGVDTLVVISATGVIAR